MNALIPASFALAAGATLLIAQGLVTSAWSPKSYDPRTGPPPLSLPEAYAAVANYLGTATNQLYCLTASCLETNYGSITGWVFEFSNTNRETARLQVFFNNGVISLDVHSAAVLRQARDNKK